MNPAVPPVHGPPLPVSTGVLGVTKIGTRNVGYWINAVAQGEEDYYSKPGEAPGVWAGSLAARLALSGEVDHDDYMAIFSGRDPRTGTQLLKRPAPRRWLDADRRERKADPVLGFDLRFAAPKSVSLAWAIGDEEVRDAVFRAHDKAVREALRHLEDVACWVQREKGGRQIERGAGFVGMGFLHRSSRAGDPALHTHMLISNMTRSVKDGKWLSLASPKGRMPLFLHAKSAGHLYQAVLRAEITRELGLAWGEVVNGHADLLGFDRRLIEHFSRRRAEIVDYMAERGVHSAKAAEVAAYRTRAEKDYGVDADRQRAEWIARAAEHGMTTELIGETVEDAIRREPRSIDADDLTAVLDEIEGHHSHFDRREVICGIATRMVDGADVAAVTAAVDRLLGDERVVAIEDTSIYTTARLAAMERKIIFAAAKGNGAGASRVDGATLAAVLARHHYLADEQAEMVRRLVTGGERVIAVAARPGTGKTTALRAAAEAWSAGGFRGIGVSTARSATVEIEAVGLPATSIAHLLILLAERDERRLPALPRGAVLVVDEASAAATEDLAALLERVEACEGKLVLMGDERQIGAVAAAGVYANLTRREGVVRLTEIRRQRDPVDREIVRLAHEDRGSDALDLLRASGRLRIADTHPEALDALVLDWHRSFAAGADAVMVARRNEDVRRLNEIARAIRADRGELGARILVGDTEFAVGDRLMTRVNVPQVSNRERWEIVAVDRRRGLIDIRRLGGDAGATLARPYLERTTPAGGPAIEHAYAMTTYAAQGKTFEEAHVLLDPGINREDFVVATSRARGHTTAYGVAAGLLFDDDLGPGPRRSGDDLEDLRLGAERVASEYAAEEVDVRAELDSLDPAALARRRADLVRAVERSGAVSPAEARSAALERRIGSARSRLDSLGEQLREAGGDPRALEAAERRRRQTSRQLERLEADRDAPGEPPALPVASPEDVAEARYELVLVEERMARLRRRSVEAEMVEPTRPILGALGYRPEDPVAARAWADGVDLIHGFRVRYGITSPDGDPLGPDSGNAIRRVERREVRREIKELQAQMQIAPVEVGKELEVRR
jgi:conjugative relaxase-like TrwC/TraI family protein